MFDPTTPAKAFLDSVPEDFLEGTFRSLVDACKQTAAICDRTFVRQVDHDVRGVICRGLFEQNWYGVATKMTPLVAEMVLNKRRTAYHTRVTAGQVIITASQVAHPKVVVRKAAFRSGYAESAQMELFQERKPAKSIEHPIYSVLLYGLDGSRSRPLFADIVFPSSKWKEYVGRIELMPLFSHLLFPEVEKQETAREVAPDVILIDPKKKKKA